MAGRFLKTLFGASPDPVTLPAAPDGQAWHKAASDFCLDHDGFAPAFAKIASDQRRGVPQAHVAMLTLAAMDYAVALTPDMGFDGVLDGVDRVFKANNAPDGLHPNVRGSMKSKAEAAPTPEQGIAQMVMGLAMYTPAHLGCMIIGGIAHKPLLIATTKEVFLRWKNTRLGHGLSAQVPAMNYKTNTLTIVDAATLPLGPLAVGNTP